MHRYARFKVACLCARHRTKQLVDRLIHEVTKQEISAQHDQYDRYERHPYNALYISKRYRPDTVESFDDLYRPGRFSTFKDSGKHSIELVRSGCVKVHGF